MDGEYGYIQGTTAIIYERTGAALDRGAPEIKIKIVRNPDGTVTKMRRGGRWCLEAEANFMGRADELGVPVPKVHDLKPKLVNVQAGESWYAITMDYVEGETLEQAWPRMTVSERTSMAQQIARIVEILRTVRQPFGQICSWRESEQVMVPLNYDTGSKLPLGDEASFIKLMLRCRRMYNIERKSYTDRLPQNGSKIMLTHGDLHERNILVKNGKVTAVLSWQYAGMFPEYWEYVQLCRRMSDPELTREVLRRWPVKYAETNAIWQEIETYDQYMPLALFRTADH